MKKMRFLAFMLSAAFLATTFTSCSDDDDGFINIFLNEDNPTEAFVGQEFTIGYSVVSEKNIKEIEILVDSKTYGNVINKFDSKLTYSGEITYTAEEAGEIKFNIKVTDKDGTVKYNDKAIVTVKEETTALGDWSEEIRLKRPETTDFKAESALINLKWTGNVLDGEFAYAAFNVATLSGSAVLVDNSDFETVEDLVEAYEAGEKVSTFVIKTDAKYEAVNYITIVEDDYVLVKTSKKATLNNGDNDAYFQYKK